MKYNKTKRKKKLFLSEKESINKKKTDDKIHK